MSEARQAVDLMNRWAPIDPEDALELLGPNFTYSTVRKYAVSRLSHAPDEVLKDQPVIRGVKSLISFSPMFERDINSQINRICSCICSSWCKRSSTRISTRFALVLIPAR
jgi:hypothetical protein